MNDYGNTKTLGDALKLLLRSKKLKQKYFYSRIKTILEEAFRGYYHEYFDNVYLRGRTLTLKITSASLKSELLLRKNDLINKLNRELEEDYIQKIEIY